MGTGENGNMTEASETAYEKICSVKELVFSIRFGHTFNRHRHEPEIDTPSESLPAVQDEYYVQYIRIDNTMSELFEKLFNPSAA